MSLIGAFARGRSCAWFVPCVVLGLSLGACVGPEPRQADTPVSITTVTSFPPDLGRGPARVENLETDLFVPLEVRRACAGLDPRFGFDSARVDPDETPGLTALATCMKTGPLAGKGVRLVGRADERGSVTYNERLGRERAEAVKLTLMKAGIDADRIEIESRGKDDAHTRPIDWDRRVDIEVIR
jgi:outer membrane protein OmpA-like peptidoglycan-associated protein